ncbi:MAG: DNA methyltransferase, partial [Acetobacteraceae bacterium]
MVVARDLLTESGSIFVQIGVDNVDLVKGLLREVFGSDNHVATIVYAKSTSTTGEHLPSAYDSLVWFAKERESLRYRQLYRDKSINGEAPAAYSRIQLPTGQRMTAAEFAQLGEIRPAGSRLFRIDNLTSQRIGRAAGEGSAMHFPLSFRGRTFKPPGSRGWTTTRVGMERLERSDRMISTGDTVSYVRFLDDFSTTTINDVWLDTVIAGFASDKVYVVQTGTKVVERCMLMTTDPGDLVLDPTCGSGTTAFVAEQWGRRWITTDTSRVALALARTRLMAGRFPAYLLRDSREGAAKEGEITGRPPEEGPFRNDIRQGLVLERVPHVTLKSIANNAEIDVIHANWAPKIEAALAALNTALDTKHAEWQVPRTLPEDAKPAVQEAHTAFWAARRARQAEMDASIARNA